MDLQKQITENFKLFEFILSYTQKKLKISNEPSEEIIKNLKLLCENVLQPLRNLVNKPIRILSGYRCKELNDAVGGSKNSQHMFGKAADICIEGISNQEIFAIIKKDFVFDQLILEKVREGVPGSGWIHVSYNAEKNDNQAFEIKKKKTSR